LNQTDQIDQMNQINLRASRAAFLRARFLSLNLGIIALDLSIHKRSTHG